MKVPMYAVRDVQVGFMTPMVDKNDGSAIRNFAYALNSSNPMMQFSPKDYDLYRIGEYDVDTGVLTPETVPVLVVAGLSVVGSKNEIA